MHEKPGNHIDINLKFVHLGLQNFGFPYVGVGTWGIPPTQNIALSLHVTPLVCPKNVDFVIFMQFLVISTKIPLPLVKPDQETLGC